MKILNASKSSNFVFLTDKKQKKVNYGLIGKSTILKLRNLIESCTFTKFSYFFSSHLDISQLSYQASVKAKPTLQLIKF